MITITAIIRARPNAQDLVRRALLSVAEAARETEPETLGYFVAQSPDDPCLFMTFERFADRAAMDRHNNSAALAEFVRDAGPHVEGDIAIHVGEEIFSK
jgi:quinol monooxygenase YgiN